MSQENVDTAQGAQDAFASGGIEAALAYFASDIVAYPFPEWVEQAVYRGHDGMRALAAVWTENFDDFEFHIEEIREVGERVLLLGEMAGRIKHSGGPIEQPIGMVDSDFRDGMIGEIRNFRTWRQALAAVEADPG
jgi:ketosteroid isomerase-like protein